MISRKWFDYSFLAFGLLLQTVTYCLMPGMPWVSLLCGCLGVCSVCLTAQGKIWMYLFGFSQVAIYLYISLKQQLYGQVAINAYYFATMAYGVFAWKRRLQEDTQTVRTRSLSGRIFVLLLSATLLVSVLAGWGLKAWTDDTQPYLDAFTTIPALVAQVLMILVYREHWFIWLAVDILSVILWFRAGDYCMAAQYTFWCANCLYGLHRWRSFGISKV